MRFKILKYEPRPLDFHRCTDEDGNIRRIYFGGSFNGTPETDESIVGKEVECETQNFIEIPKRNDLDFIK